MDSNYLNMEMKHISSTTMELEEERDGDWSRWAKRALESCGLWCGHVKGKPLVEMATEEGQTRNLKSEDEADQETTLESGIEEAYEERSKLVKVSGDKRVICGLSQGKDELYQLVGRLREGWMELDVLRPSTADPRVIKKRTEQDVFFSFLVEEIWVLTHQACAVWEENKRSNQWKGGTSCKKGRLRKLSRVWLKMGKAWKKNMESGYLTDKMSLKMIKEVAQQVVRGECSYSAYMSNSVEDSMVMKEQEIKRADDPITKKEWDGFVTYSESGVQEQHQGDSGHHDQEVTEEVENVPQVRVDEQGEVHDPEEVTETETEVQAELKLGKLPWLTLESKPRPRAVWIREEQSG
ncbi:hypothetical protein IGI04_019297 [Brassica rapa subsp. trilocularis]|uniref:Uncharacterized protein n=1 Tax=Brassica rapa subsp. trilocularis TaxID=1813537 RepID=A0ABQ7MH19_BRACM|nr:hypothetical protein IGI04_019297 [Brassica rapa subsp. trilocularis]